ncbi:2-dehydropantoate 2-reductase [Phyllobacterium sp. P30BS-XVII]|uniref:2-dehydropantoate 2-reductase n=1 Tax=Phyllobacterium sp. P30BS-XVII TaxID=2587046 RepID=UPI0017BB2AC7|nr:2-dehydropantoate 2-reductase [Phyllobacterium sp. P30BS-XVII]MBA8899322.1 2-dehydropantoate 2-reductase [Phyllobacterium sp. P30BS-XVII]
MMIENNSRIVVAGAGSIGCYVGGHLAASGKAVTFLARPRVEEEIRQAGLKVITLDGTEHSIPADQLSITVDPASAFDGARIILVAVKSGATQEMAGLITKYAPADSIVVSLQNGVGNAQVLRKNLPESMTVIAGMVPFNVVQSASGQLPLTVRRTTAGTILIENRAEGLAEVLTTPQLPVSTHDNMQGILWGKLMMNLNNALNALSNLPLATQLADRDWRVLLADQMGEGLKVMQAHSIVAARVQGVSPAILRLILLLPNFLFRRVARKILAIDPRARSSMWEDFSRGRTTEIDYLQGVIVQLAREKNIPTPLAEKVIACVRQAEGQPIRSHAVTEIRQKTVL